MPFGGKNCPAAWSRASDMVFKNCMDLIKYVDDLNIASTTETDHIIAIREFFDRLRKHNLKIKLSKCEFFQDEVEFVGHRISSEGIRPSKKYIKKIIQLSEPTNKKEVRTYCGFVQWLGKYCYGLKDALHPISQLNKRKNKFKWTEVEQQAFEHVQQIIEALSSTDNNYTFCLLQDVPVYINILIS